MNPSRPAPSHKLTTDQSVSAEGLTADVQVVSGDVAVLGSLSCGVGPVPFFTLIVSISCILTKMHLLTEEASGPADTYGEGTSA